MYKRDINPWERQEGESSKAFEAFVIYRDMGAKRTFTAVADTLHKSCTLIRRWKEQWDWEKEQWLMIILLRRRLVLRQQKG